jgi:monothiol glutaredoxin
MSEAASQKIESLIAADDIVLFMKGTRQFPQCGFSSTVVQILSEIGLGYETVNVLADADIRSGIKVFSDWPTIPQLYVRGEFVGGCDIIKNMHASGELAKTLHTGAFPVDSPTVTITDAAVMALRSALAEENAGDHVHLSIDAQFATSMDIAPREASDIAVESNGLTVLLDPASARLAEGLSIDFLDTAEQTGFKIENPNAPPKVIEMSPSDLKAKLDSGEIKEFFDVRTQQEHNMAAIDGARLLDDTAAAYIEALDPKTPIAFHCHHGMRSRSAAQHFLKFGFRKLYNLSGGIDAWSMEIDTSVPRY